MAGCLFFVEIKEGIKFAEGYASKSPQMSRISFFLSI
jgi:hypothetical protein